MNSRERVFSALDYQGWDRPPTHHYGTPEIDDALRAHFGVEDHESLARILGDDFRYLDADYTGPELRTFPDGTWEGIWGERYEHYCFGEGHYPEACFLPYARIDDPAELDKLRWPSADWWDTSKVRERAQAIRDAGFVAFTGDAGIPDFMNGIARCRGVEQVLFDIGDEDPVWLELMKRRFDYFFEKHERVLSAAGGLIDIVCFGEDLGNQNGLMISPATFDEMFAPYFERMFAQAHAHGARTMMHSCGSCYGLIPRLIELGLDILEVVQVDCANMDIEKLHREFYGKIAFCGSMSVQSTLPHGTIDDVVREVELRKRLFKQGGMVIAPTHAIQVGTPLENIIAMYDAIGSLDPAAAPR